MITVKVVQEVDVTPATVTVISAQFLGWLEGKGFHINPDGVTTPVALTEASFEELGARFAAEHDGGSL